ncbi:hypothetical protein RSA37_11670 [Mammaliicoccus sciuri]|uniref:hypothetical protein n=1 Tax=Mammaliicoccus sciuri TaxID=1296 RepID=UPI000734D31A|nr:hypothetical protein [Mammaliicoccus sciuri]KTT82691.1 hypothetical protein NS1R_11930 [Mammaliicoccus sciuri]KTT88252.1 hypothetical protein NS112_09560 [Mammaliicoccus sciuri]KTT89795.1 hypothetical protein NS36R_08085 [Mammaliicoccus sciuri]KTT94187.1 hypothetical protein NS44R_08500 [Mammaliicoccus sciuri]KTW10707.1 hypothetical protein RSA37_11670 [Mammaliicoccus sciuri]
MTTTWHFIKYPVLTLLVVIEFFIIAAFSVTPFEHSFLFWLLTVMLFEMWDQVKEMEGNRNE